MNCAGDERSRRTTALLGGLCGIAGVTLLDGSFALLPAPPRDAGLVELIRFGQEHHSAVLIGAWLQAVAPLLIATFAFALVHLSGATTRISGWMTFLGISILIATSLMEVTFYVCALAAEPPGIALVSLRVIDAVQHLYFIVAAPAVFLPLGSTLLNSRIVPLPLAYTAIGLAVAFAVLGAVFMLTVTLPGAVTALGAIQTLWWLSAAISLIVKGGRTNQAIEFAA